MSDTESPDGQISADPIVNEAHKRRQRCVEWEAYARQNFIEDLKFRHGDSVNGYQWPNAIRHSRDTSARPCLTMNIVRQHNLQIVNEGKQNKLDVDVRAVGNGATAESATALKAVLRRIQYQSSAQDAYNVAREFQVDAGYASWRLVTEYIPGSDQWAQDIFIRPVGDPLSVYYDPDAKLRDKSDGKFAFVDDLVPKDEFAEAYPEFVDLVGMSPLGMGAGESDWETKDHIRICEYFRKVPKRDRLISFVSPTTGKRMTVRESHLHRDIRKAVLDDPLTQWRTLEDVIVEWYLIAGNQVIDHTIWPTDQIPLIPLIGEEIIIDGVMDRKSHTRAMMDAQRMFNYNASAQVEFVALQGKTPWKAAAAAIEEYEQLWNTANTENPSVLVFNHIDDEGNPIPPPERQEPPQSSPAYESGMQTAFNQMMMTSGQWQNQMGMGGNERTGEAISRRQDQGDTATFHFKDSFEAALVATGKQLIKLVPKVYDTARIIRCQADDGTDLEIEIDPAARQAYLEQRGRENQIAKRIFNPSLGNYDVQAVPGNAWGTRREETVKAMTLLLTQAPGLTGVIGDLLLSAMDFKEAQEAALRLKRMVPPQALGTGPTQVEQQLHAQVAQLQQLLSKALDATAKDRLKLVGKDQIRDIDVYKAETDRFKALADAMMLDQGGVRSVVEQLVQESLQTNLQPILAANSGGVKDQAEGDGDDGTTSSPSASPSTGSPPVPGAQQAPDGEWYLADPTRKGKYLRVAPLAQQRSARSVISNA